MDINEQLSQLKAETPLTPREAHFRQTLEKSKEIYFRQEQDHLATYLEFLWGQFRYTRKRWWALQGALLLLAMWILPGMEADFYRVRTLGVIGCLFVTLVMPELWRNRENDATQIEAACLYSLRQIYAARMTLFGITDVALLSLFCLNLGRLGFSTMDVLSQFLLPATVTGCILFSLLCGGQREIVSLSACLCFCAGWWLLIMNEQIYVRILPPVWAALFAAAVLFLLLVIRKTILTTNQSWEIDAYGITTA